MYARRDDGHLFFCLLQRRKRDVVRLEVDADVEEERLVAHGVEVVALVDVGEAEFEAKLGIDHHVFYAAAEANAGIGTVDAREGVFAGARAVFLDFAAYAKAISARCWRDTSIPVSVGIAPTKTLAKIASKLCKQYPKLKGGCYMHRPQDIEKVLRKFPVADVWGIGRRSVKKLDVMGVKTAWDYAQLPEETVRKLFALPGWRTRQELRGIPCIGLEDLPQDRQSICVSRSFAHEITQPAQLAEQVANFAEAVVEKLRKQGSLALEMVVFAFTNRFKENAPQAHEARVVVFPEGEADYRKLVPAAVRACQEIYRPGYGYKKAGVVVTKLMSAVSATGSLFADSEAAQRDARLSGAIDSINRSFGPGAIRFGVQGSGEVYSTREHQSPHYTTRWEDIPTVKL